MKKNKTKITTAFVIALLLNSISYSQELDPYQFFPANVGDRWEYTLAGPNQIYTVIRDSIDTKDSSRFVFFYDPPLYYGADYRIDKKYQVFRGPQFNNRLIYKLDAKVGDSWIVRLADERAAKVLNISQAYVFGKLTTVKTIGFYRLTQGDTVITQNSILLYWEKIAYGFGMISQEDGASQPTLLRGCRIGGVTYGTVGVKELPNDLPSDFILHQNYPNPFNPSTTISFSIPRYSHVTIKVFDLLGREIQDLANDYFNPGTYKVEFNERNLASGIYFYQLIADKTVRTMKMMLQK